MARRVNKELEKLKHIEYHIDDIVNDETVSELIHYFAIKHGRKLLMTNHATERVEVNFERLDEALRYLGETGGIHDRYKFYPTMNDRIKKNFTEEQDELMFFERLINSNNRAKGVMTEDILTYAFNPQAEEYFVEFLKLMCHTYRKNGFDKELEKLYDKHIGDYHNIISNSDDIVWLREYKNQRRLYNLLSKGGTIYQKSNNLDCFKSLFYHLEKVDIKDLYKYKDIDWEEDFAIKSIPLSFETIMNLVKYNYLNKSHLEIDIKYLLDRNFYIPKKKRRKRIYTEDKSYLIIKDSDFNFSKIRYLKGRYNTGTPKIVRDKKAYKKQYIPAIKPSKKKEEWIDIYQINIASIDDIIKYDTVVDAIMKKS